MYKSDKPDNVLSINVPLRSSFATSGSSEGTIGYKPQKACLVGLQPPQPADEDFSWDKQATSSLTKVLTFFLAFSRLSWQN